MGKVRVKAENSTFLTFSWSSATKTNSLLACVLLQGAAALHIDTHTCLAIAKLVIPFSLFFPALTLPPSFHICVTTFFFSLLSRHVAFFIHINECEAAALPTAACRFSLVFPRTFGCVSLSTLWIEKESGEREKKDEGHSSAF